MKNTILETENLATREQLVIARIQNLKVKETFDNRQCSIHLILF